MANRFERTQTDETTKDTDGDGVIEHEGEYKSPVVEQSEAGEKVVLPMPQEEQVAQAEAREAAIQETTPEPTPEPEQVEIDS